MQLDYWELKDLNACKEGLARFSYYLAVNDVHKVQLTVESLTAYKAMDMNLTVARAEDVTWLAFRLLNAKRAKELLNLMLTKGWARPKQYRQAIEDYERKRLTAYHHPLHAPVVLAIASAIMLQCVSYMALKSDEFFETVALYIEVYGDEKEDEHA